MNNERILPMINPFKTMLINLKKHLYYYIKTNLTSIRDYTFLFNILISLVLIVVITEQSFDLHMFFNTFAQL